MFWLALVLALFQITPSQPLPRDAAAAGSHRTAVVRGRITDRESGRPLVRAVVTLGSEAAAEETVTDTDGRYRFTALPPGRYVVDADPGPYRATHLPQYFGASRPKTSNRVGPWFPLGDGEIRTADIALSRTAAIGGRAVGPGGQPLANLTVTAQSIRGGAATSAITDDRGAFRLFGLSPGSYRVCAVPRGGQAASPDPADERYVRTCAPGVVGESEADVIVLNEDATADVEIRLQRRGTYSVSGVVVDAAGAGVESGGVSIASLDRQERSTSDDVRQGQFTVHGMGPGRYAVWAAVGAPAVPGVTRPPAREYEAGAAVVQIDSADVAGVVVALSKAAEVSGRVVFEPSDARPESPGALRIVARSTDRVLAHVESSGEPVAKVGDDFTFSLSGLFGPHILMISGAPAGWVVKAARYQGREILDVPTDFTTQREPARLEIVLTDRGSDLSARVVDAAGRPTTDCLVAILPADRSRWEAFRHGWFPSQPASGDVMRLGLFPPGEYLVAALDDDDFTWLARDPEALESFVRTAQRITVTERGSRTIDLPLVRLDGGQR